MHEIYLQRTLYNTFSHGEDPEEGPELGVDRFGACAQQKLAAEGQAEHVEQRPLPCAERVGVADAESQRQGVVLVFCRHEAIVHQELAVGPRTIEDENLLAGAEPPPRHAFASVLLRVKVR